MGYRPDAMVQALAAYRSMLRPTTEQGTLAWIRKENAASSSKTYLYQSYFEGAAARAGELGYRLEQFSFGTGGMTSARISSILRARGIRGIIVAPQPAHRAYGRINMDWSGFSAAAIGYSLAWPPISTVSNHQFQTAQTACRKLRSLGYERIGICVDRITEERVHNAFVGGYLSDRIHRATSRMIEPFVYEKWNLRLLEKWIKRHKLQAVIFHNSHDADRLIEGLGLRVPEDLGVVCLNKTEKGYAAINQNSEQIGAAAVDLVVSMIHRQESGLPKVCQRLMIDGTWNDGYSVKRLTPRIVR